MRNLRNESSLLKLEPFEYATSLPRDDCWWCYVKAQSRKANICLKLIIINRTRFNVSLTHKRGLKQRSDREQTRYINVMKYFMNSINKIEIFNSLPGNSCLEAPSVDVSKGSRCKNTLNLIIFIRYLNKKSFLHLRIQSIRQKIFFSSEMTNWKIARMAKSTMIQSFITFSYDSSMRR